MNKTLERIIVKLSASGSRLVVRAMAALVLAITLGVASTAQAQTAIFTLSGVGPYAQSSSSQIFGTCTTGRTVTVFTQIGGGTSGNSIQATAKCGSSVVTSATATDAPAGLNQPNNPPVHSSFKADDVDSGGGSFPQCITKYTGAPDSTWVAVCVFY
jgi:hypothetical protein